MDIGYTPGSDQDSDSSAEFLHCPRLFLIGRGKELSQVTGREGPRTLQQFGDVWQQMKLLLDLMLSRRLIHHGLAACICISAKLK